MKRKIFLYGVIGVALCLAFHGGRAKADKKVDKAGKYHAALGVETDYYKSVHRESYYKKDAEKRDDWKKLVIGTSGKAGYQILEGTFKDAVIKGNGSYAVTLKNADFNGNRSFKKLYVATDIPNTGEIRFSNLSVSINGRVLRTFEKPVLDSKSHKGKCVLLVIDPDDEEVRNAVSRRTVPTGSENEIKLRFTVKGFDYKKGEAPPTPEPEPEVTPEVQEENETHVADETEKEDTPVVTEEPKAEKKASEEVSVERKIGIVVTVVIAIGGIVLCLVIVTKRQH